MTSRLTSDARMPSVPIVSPSLIAIVLNSIGVPPALRTPSFTFAESRRKWKLHGMVSIQVFATPISGFARSSLVKPIALNIERAPARSRPSVMERLRCFRSIGLKAYDRAQESESLPGSYRSQNRITDYPSRGSNALPSIKQLFHSLQNEQL